MTERERQVYRIAKFNYKMFTEQKDNESNAIQVLIQE